MKYVFSLFVFEVDFVLKIKYNLYLFAKMRKEKFIKRKVVNLQMRKKQLVNVLHF